MARKIIPALAMMFMAFICLASYIIISPSAPANRVLQFSPADSTALQASLPFRAPQNVEFVREDDSLRITWDIVPGATGYNVYTCENAADTTVYVPYAMYDFEKLAFVYKYSYHPRFGEVYTWKTPDMVGYNMKMYEKMTLTPWAKVNDLPLSRNEYAIAKAELPTDSNFYYVTAVR